MTDHHLSRRPRSRWISGIDRSRYLPMSGEWFRAFVDNVRDPYMSKASNCERDESRNVHGAINLPRGRRHRARRFSLAFLFFPRFIAAATAAVSQK